VSVRVLWAAVTLFAAILCSGCAGDGPASTEDGSSFDTIQREIFQRSCLDAGCHNATDRAENLNLEAGFSYANLIDIVATNAAARAAGWRRVVPSDPEASFLFLKIVGPPSQFGTRMPQGKPALSNAEVEQIRAWIASGAPGPASPQFTATPTSSATRTATVTPQPSSTPTASITPTPTTSATATVSPTGTLPPTASRTATASATPTPSSTATASPTSSPTILPGSTFAEIQTAIFNASCLNLGCHNGTDRAGDLSLAADDAYAQLVGVAPVQPNAVSRGMKRVLAGNPTSSFLFVKVTLPTAFDVTFSGRMPQGAAPLSSDSIERLRAWILRGAPPAE